MSVHAMVVNNCLILSLSAARGSVLQLCHTVIPKHIHLSSMICIDKNKPPMIMLSLVDIQTGNCMDPCSDGIVHENKLTAKSKEQVV